MNSDGVTSARCLLCGHEEQAIALAEANRIRDTLPAYNLDAPNTRHFVSGRYALLHHACPSPQANTETRWWQEDRYWWACHDPSRPIDDDAQFDINCGDCAVRWAQRLAP